MSLISNIDSKFVENPTSRTENSKIRFKEDEFKFIKIFIEQIKNQIPTEPMDHNQMSQLTAAFSQVQQQVETNISLEKLVKASENRLLGTPISYLGTEISTDTAYANLKNNKADFIYNLPTECREVTINIRDNNGKIVSSENGSTNAGYNEFMWNGRNSQGVKFPDGEYNIEVKGLKSAKEKIAQSNEIIKLDNSNSKFSYYIPDEYDNYEISIKNQKNNEIFKSKAGLKNGNHEFHWDGKDNFNNIVEDGEYNYEIRARKLDKSDILNSNFLLSDNKAEFKYNSPNRTKNILVSIKNDSLKTVYNKIINQSSGENNFIWDGIGDEGEHLPKNKEYNIEIYALRTPILNDNIVKPDTIFKGLVTGVDTSGIDPTLTVNGKQIALNKIRTVSLT